MRKIFLTVHLWLGVAATLLVLVTAGTGCIVAFEPEIDHALNRSLWHVQPVGTPLPPSAIVAAAHRAYPQMRPVSFLVPERPDLAWRVAYGKGIQLFINGYTGEVNGMHDGTSFVLLVHRIHTGSIAGPIGSEIVGWGSLVLCVLALSGLLLWWRAKIVRVVFGGSWKRLTFTLHNTTGIVALPIILILGLTGLALHFEDPFAHLVGRVAGPIPRPPTADVIAGAQPITIDRVFEIASHAIPDARVQLLLMGRENGGAIMRVRERFPGDRSPAGGATVYINRYTGEIAGVMDPRQATASQKIIQVQLPLHSGAIFGLPTQVVAAVAALSAVIQSITGFAIWLQRRRRKLDLAVSETVGELTSA